MDSKLSLKSHLKYISKKISFITYKLYGLRLLDNLKLSINLFKVFLMPLYRLAFTVYSEANVDVRKSLITHMKVRLKVFAESQLILRIRYYLKWLEIWNTIMKCPRTRPSIKHALTTWESFKVWASLSKKAWRMFLSIFLSYYDPYIIPNASNIKIWFWPPRI